MLHLCIVVSNLSDLRSSGQFGDAQPYDQSSEGSNLSHHIRVCTGFRV